ncbi:unnamed protein product [Orchesella dallaii]|uniref:F-box domain-containing protein n=1 Tax=Orchesella dallaii TaxID=48710 RepID=A0ABP1QLF3_9HEXA
MVINDAENEIRASLDNHQLGQFQPHPLLIDHIVDQIFQNLITSCVNLSHSRQQLCKVRLVCRQWNKAATNLLRKNFQQIFGGLEHNIGQFKRYLEIVHPDTRALWTKLPFTRFTFHSDVFQASTSSSVISFLKICGPELESLVIHKDIYSDAVYEDESMIDVHVPRLKRLAYHDRRRSNISTDATSQKLLFALVTSAKDSLQSLTIQFPREPAYEQQIKQEILIRLLKENGLPNLSCLKLDVLITDEILDTLTEMKLPLKELHFSVGASKFSATSLKRLLETLQYSLQILKITDLFRRSEVTLEFPRLQHLQIFEIHGFELPAYQVSFPNFSYDLVPNLRKLQLRTWAPTLNWEVFFSHSKSTIYSYHQPNILVTELSLAMNFDSVLLMKRIAATFTKLKRLEMYFSRAHVPALEIVFKEMTQLEELRLNQSYLGEISTTCIDDVLSGLSSEECQWILKHKAFSRTDFHHLESKPGLTNLKNLKRLDIINLRHRNLVTDVTGYMVFLRMPTLRCLAVGHSEMSTKCLWKLAQAYPETMLHEYLNRNRISCKEDGLSKNSVFTSACSVL